MKSGLQTLRSTCSNRTNGNWGGNSGKIRSGGTPKKRSSTLSSRARSQKWSEQERNKSTSWMASMKTKPTPCDTSSEKGNAKLRTKIASSTTWSRSTKCWSTSSRKCLAREPHRKNWTSRFRDGCHKLWPRRICLTCSSKTKCCSTAPEQTWPSTCFLIIFHSSFADYFEN